MRSSPVNSGDNVLASQYDNLRLDAQPASYLYPHQQSSPNMTLYVEAGCCFIGGTKVIFAGGNSPTFSAPGSNNIINLLVIDSSGTLSIVVGTSGSSPTAPAYPKDKIVLAEVYIRSASTSIKDSDDSTNGYIYNHVRPFLNNEKSISQTGAEIYADDTGSTNAFAVTLNPAPTAYVEGMVINFKAGSTNTGSATLNVNSLGAKSIKKSGTASLSSGDIVSGMEVSVIYDGTNFQILSQTAVSLSTVQVAGVAGATIASAGNNDETQSSTYVMMKQFTVSNPGSYNVAYSISAGFNSSGSGTPVCHMEIYKNGVDTGVGDTCTYTGGGQAHPNQTVGGFNAGDTLEIWIKQTGGVSGGFYVGVSGVSIAAVMVPSAVVNLN